MPSFSKTLEDAIHLRIEVGRTLGERRLHEIGPGPKPAGISRAWVSRALMSLKIE